MTDALSPYRIEGPALISVSGGRTSGFMLRRILDANGGRLPDRVIAGFANTGKEDEATLRFVHEMESRWDVRIHWIEFLTDLRSVGAAGRYVEVGYNSASRHGEPFERLIERKQAIPTVATGRSCTERLKVMALQDLAEVELGLRPGEFVETIGFRSDEDDRRKRLTAKARNEGRRFAFPMIEAGVRKEDIFRFWGEQPFDLDLPRGFGNCDQCPFVGVKNRIARARRNPAGVEQWARWELAKGVHMGKTYSFVEILGLVAQSPELLPDDDADAECTGFCGS